MPHKIKSAPSRYVGLWPANGEDRHALVKLSSYAVLAMIATAGLWFLQQHWHQVRELTWAHATAAIEEVRPVLVTKRDGPLGSAMLYDAQVLVRFSDGAETKESWITVRQTPRSLRDVQFESFRWKGQTCVVRWNPANPSQIDVEVG